jgi:chromatin remodeling complex protein RSC6
MAVKKKKANSAFMRPLEVSEELEAVVGNGPMPRTEVTKKLWVYIKKHKLQDPNNLRNIKPDEKLAKVFGSKKTIDMFQMTKLVSKHLE